VIEVLPWELVEVIVCTPAMVENVSPAGCHRGCHSLRAGAGQAGAHRNRGVVDGREIAHRQLPVATSPKITMPAITSVVMTGRRMKTAVKFIRPQPRGIRRGLDLHFGALAQAQLPVRHHPVARLNVAITTA